MSDFFTKGTDLKTTPTSKLFFSYFVPSLVGMLVLSTYVVFDGIFIGMKIGEVGLAAVNICFPIFPIFIAFALLFGLGAASLASSYLGKGMEDRAREIFSTVVYFAIITSVVGCLMLFFFRVEIANFLGANDILMPYVSTYLGVILLGAFMIIAHPLLEVFARNDQKQFLAMISMIGGALSNIGLNYLFIFILELGVFGAALATVLGHGIGFFILLIYFFGRRGWLYFVLKFNIRQVFSSAKNGIPPCIAEVSSGIIVLIFNKIIIDIAGESGVAIYSVIMYTASIVFVVLMSITQGMQPISSYNYGHGSIDRVKSIFRFSYMFAFLVGLGLYILFFIFSPWIVLLFLDSSSEILSNTVEAIRIYFVGYIMLGYNIICGVFFQSVQRTLSSFIVTISSTLLWIIITVPILSNIYGLHGVWASFPVSLIFATFVTFGVVFYEKRYGILSPPFVIKGLK